MRLARDIGIALVVMLGMGWKIYKVYRASERVSARSETSSPGSAQPGMYPRASTSSAEVKIAAGAFVADSTDAFEDDDTLQEARASGHAYPVRAGTKAKVIQFEGAAAQIELTEGPLEGRVFWISVASIGPAR